MDDITALCRRRRLRLQEVFQDSDALRHGVINRNRFRRGLTTMGVELSEAEFLTLADAFAVPGDGAGSSSGIGTGRDPFRGDRSAAAASARPGRVAMSRSGHGVRGEWLRDAAGYVRSSKKA